MAVVTAKVLLIEGKHSNKHSSFAVHLRRRYHVTEISTGNEALKLSQDDLPDVVVLNAASLRTSGDRICSALRKRLPEVPIIQIRNTDSTQPPTHHADVTLFLPFTSRKLVNRIERFIASKDGEILQAGPFRLNLKSRILITPKSEHRLTPKQATLVEIFLRHPNITLKRSDLMAQVWQTDYLGDTRTLDVHVRWLREVLESNPSKPVYLKTVRGIGYCLDLTPPRKPRKSEK